MNTHSGRFGGHIAPSSFKVCLYMLPSQGRGRQKGWFATVASVVSQGWTLRQMSLLSSLWDTKLPERRSGTYSMKCTCLRGCPGCPVHPPFGLKQMEEATRDILSSLSFLWERGYPLTGRRPMGSCCTYSSAQPPDQTPPSDPRDGWPTW